MGCWELGGSVWQPRFFNKLGRAVNNAVIAADIYFGVVRSFRKLYMKKYSFNRR